VHPAASHNEARESEFYSIFPPAYWWIRTRPRCLTETTCHNIQIPADPPGSARTVLPAKRVSMDQYASRCQARCMQNALRCGPIRPHPTASTRIQMDFVNLSFFSDAALHTGSDTRRFSPKAPDTSRSEG
jgi:hypothetical protein